MTDPRTPDDTGNEASGIVDATQRRRALEIGESFIVQAPAGSGKTELLTQRFLRLLAVVRHPEEICAITFTRKAAAEMRNRILSALDRARGAQPDAAHERLTWQLARAALSQDGKQGWQLRDNPNRLRIQTFDSLAHSLARQMPLLSEFGAAPSTTEQADPHYREAARATLRMLDDEQLGPAIERVLVHLDNRQAQLEELLCNMLSRRDQWLPHAVIAPDGLALESALEEAVREHLQGLLAHSPADWLQGLCSMAQQAANNIDTQQLQDHALAGWRERDSTPGDRWDELGDWRGLAELLLTGKGDPRKSWTAKQGFPAPSEKGIGAEQKARRQQAKVDIKALSAQLAERPDALAAWQGLRRLPMHGLDQQQHEVLASLLRVLLHASIELTLVFREAGEVDFVETQMRAQRALGSPDEPTDLALALDYRLQHLLVDEFQDTSSSQYRLLETLTAAWQPDDGRTLFAVGDPMQSIYRFREAKVGLYLGARESGIGHLKLTPLTLSVNFRSSRSIVDWVNTCFAQIFPHEEDIARGAVTYASAVAFDQSHVHAAIEVHPFAGRDDQAEARHVVELVRTALDQTGAGQVAVLARARSHLHTIASALKQAGVAFQAVDVDPLAGQAVVQDLYNLTRALLHPADRLAWLVVLRAPSLGLTLADLLIVAEASPRCVLARLRDRGLRQQLSDDGRHRVERLLAVVDTQLPARGRQPLRQWVEGIWLSLGGLAAAGTQAMDDAQAFLALLDAHEHAGGLQDFSQLETAMDSLYAAPDSLADGRVQLMTMHKSKGLEFDTVILPGLGRRPRGTSTELLYWLERTTASAQTRLLMAPIRASQQTAEPISDYLRDLDRDMARLEVTRLVYVAATRAKRRLHLLGHIGFSDNGEPMRPIADSLLEKLWPVIAPDFDALSAPTAKAEDAPAFDLPPLLRLPSDWRLQLPAASTPASEDHGRDTAPPIPDFDWAGDTARHVGTLVHRQLERIATEGLANWPIERIADAEPAIRLGLRNLGVDAAELDRGCTKAMRALRQMLEHDTGRWLLDEHTAARCEWPLTLHDDVSRHYIIDRTFIDTDGVRWIVDYKTGEHLGEDRDGFLDQEQTRYRDQLDNYARIVRELEDRPIRLALYFPLFPDWRVWDFDG